MLKKSNKVLFFIPPEIIFYFDLKIFKFFLFGLIGWSSQNIFERFSFIYSASFCLIRSFFLSSFLLNNLVFGLIKMYSKYLQLRGRSFRFFFGFTSLILKFGFSHKLYYTLPNYIRVTLITKHILKISGKSLQRLKSIFFDLHSIRKFDKYKGKGLLYYKDALILKESSKKTKV